MLLIRQKSWKGGLNLGTRLVTMLDVEGKRAGILCVLSSLSLPYSSPFFYNKSSTPTFNTKKAGQRGEKAGAC